MEIQGIIVNKTNDTCGISKSSGEPWRIASYLVNLSNNSGSLVFDVRDGREGRIEKLNLQVGHKYNLRISFEANFYNGRWFNKIICFAAQEVSLTSEDAETVASSKAPAPQQNNAPAPVAESPTPAPAPEPTPEGEGEGPIDDLPF